MAVHRCDLRSLTMFNVILVGAGGFGRELRQLLPDCLPADEYQFKGYLGKDQGVGKDAEARRLTLSDPEVYEPQPRDRFILAIGDMDARRRSVEAITAKGGQFISLIHPSSFVARTVKLGRGVIVYPFATVSNEVVLGDYAKLNFYASAGHNAIIGKYCLLAPYATVNGFGVLEDEVYLSTHSTVAPVVRVGFRSKVSANSAVMKTVPAESLVHGVPGRVTPRVKLL
jgi:sugar O-acyltransferase (sialic acid O-acetyltransferase NeuD family)